MGGPGLGQLLLLRAGTNSSGAGLRRRLRDLRLPLALADRRILPRSSSLFTNSVSETLACNDREKKQTGE